MVWAPRTGRANAPRGRRGSTLGPASLVPAPPGPGASLRYDRGHVSPYDELTSPGHSLRVRPARIVSVHEQGERPVVSHQIDEGGVRVGEVRVTLAMGPCPS